MTKALSIAVLLVSTSAMAQQLSSNDLANCLDEVKAAHLDFSHKLAAWNARIARKAVLTGDEGAISSALGAAGRGKQYQEVTIYGLAQYCNDLKKVDDEATKAENKK